jgi:hypothetical protein
MDPNSCREVLTVNVNQINQDLIRQVSSVLSHHDIHHLLQPSTSTNLPTNLSHHHLVSSVIAQQQPWFCCWLHQHPNYYLMRPFQYKLAFYKV